jgi:hypothetical protein
LEENSPYIAKYQPKRETGQSVNTAYTTKTIVSKKGETRTFQVAIKDKCDEQGRTIKTGGKNI